MPVIQATILIPDISGFTDFMTTVELEHGSHLISSFLEVIIQQVDESFEVGEIEGDAVLLYKKEGSPSKQEIIDLCRKIFNAFHYQRKLVENAVICSCGACQGLINLTLKFIAHHGSITEIKINRFTKASGLDMIIAHRLLKNSIVSHEYVLITDKFLEQAGDDNEVDDLKWQSLSDEFPAIGKVQYQYALLDSLKKKIPDPPKPEMKNYNANVDFVEEYIDAPINDVYMIVINMPERVRWLKGLKKLEQEDDHVYIGSRHKHFFDNLEVIVSPGKIELGDEEIIYAEVFILSGEDLEIVFEYRFKKQKDGCQLIGHIGSLEEQSIPHKLYDFLFDLLKTSIKQLKVYCESAFKPI